MARKYLLNPNLPYFKANLHGHTVISDGCLKPDEYKSAYLKQGYGIIAITDHEKYRFHRELNSGDFVCLASCEEEIYPAPSGDEIIDREKKCYHFNVYDLKPRTRPAGYTSPPPPRDYHNIDAINAWIERLRKDDLLVCYNHPAWSMQDFRDYAGLKGLWAMEIYNHGCEVEGMYGAAPQVYDEMLRSGRRLFCAAGDDNHNKWPFESQYSDSFGGFTMFNLPCLNYENTAEAMRRGGFYASSGPLLSELSVEGRSLRVSASPVKRICVFTESRRCYIKAANPGAYITQADFEISGTEVYLRAQIEDGAGKFAYSRAYFKSEL